MAWPRLGHAEMGANPQVLKNQPSGPEEDCVQGNLEGGVQAWKLAQSKPVGEKYEDHGQGPPSLGMATSDAKGTKLIGTVISLCSSSRKSSEIVSGSSKIRPRTLPLSRIEIRVPRTKLSF